MVYLRQLSRNDGPEIYEMLQDIKTVEHSFTNPAGGMSYDQYRQWLLQQEQWASGIGLPADYVPQIIYWLYDSDTPVGFGKIRLRLTAASRSNGGNIGYAVRQKYRGRGYGNQLLALLLAEARRLQIGEILLTVDRDNSQSRKVCEANRGVLICESPERCFYQF